MSLDSSETPSKAQKSENGNVSPNMKSDAEVKICSDESENSWSYIMAHHTKVNNIISKLEQHFTVFIHTSTVFFKEKGKVKSLEKPTISGLVFIQGKTDNIQKFLSENFINIYLVKDRISGKPAVISNKNMSAFMQLSGMEPDRIRFMPKPFYYYSDGHVRIKITSGVLSGMEGYIVRISRNRYFVTSIGGLTIAISGVHKETFENSVEFMNLYNSATEKNQVSEVIDQVYQSLKD